MAEAETPLALSELATGDVVTFFDRHSLFSNAVAWATGDNCSHVGMVVVNPPWRRDLRGVFLLESDAEHFPDAEDGEFKVGVALNRFAEVVRRYPTRDIHVRRLTGHQKFADEELIRAHSLVHNRPYDTTPSHWLVAALGLGRRRTDRRFWCSALVACMYVQLGLLPADFDWTHVAPAQFDSGAYELPLLHGELGPPHPLVIAEQPGAVTAQ
jgi:hypothetical protein